ncbi:MAG: glycosyl hydrolase family 18 protein [Flavobacteriales bacterium]
MKTILLLFVLFIYYSSDLMAGNQSDTMVTTDINAAKSSNDTINLGDLIAELESNFRSASMWHMFTNRELYHNLLHRTVAMDRTYQKLEDLQSRIQNMGMKDWDLSDSLKRSQKELRECTDYLKVKLDSVLQFYVICDSCKSEISAEELKKLAAKIAPLVEQSIKVEELMNQELKARNAVRDLLVSSKIVYDTISETEVHKKLLQINRKGKVFGYHPQWMNSSYNGYNFKLLTTLAYYGYDLNIKNGGYDSLYGWLSAPIVDDARRENCNVVLTVFEKNDVSAFFNSYKNYVNLATNVCRLIRVRNANGINIRFDQLPLNCDSKFVEFIHLLSDSLKKSNAGYELSVTLPADPEKWGYDLKGLNPYVDLFIIDFSMTSAYGPIAPISGHTFAMEESFAYYLNQEVPAGKFLACLPYFGKIWNAERSVSENISYGDIVEKYMQAEWKVYDEQSAFLYWENDIGEIKEIWYDDARTLSAKYEYSLDNGLGGVAIWSLGYDRHQPELWNALLDNLFEVDTIPLDTILIISPKSGFWDAVKYECAMYGKLFADPCKFNDMYENKDILKTKFLIGPILLLMVGLLVFLIFFAIYKSRMLGEDWTRRQRILQFILFQTAVVIFFALLYLSLKEDFHYFGDSKYGHCESLPYILTILGCGLVIGLFMMRFLVMPLMKRKEIP